jgi:hypothetical protein
MPVWLRRRRRCGLGGSVPERRNVFAHSDPPGPRWASGWTPRRERLAQSALYAGLARVSEECAGNPDAPRPRPPDTGAVRAPPPPGSSAGRSCGDEPSLKRGRGGGGACSPRRCRSSDTELVFGASAGRGSTGRGCTSEVTRRPLPSQSANEAQNSADARAPLDPGSSIAVTRSEVPIRASGRCGRVRCSRRVFCVSTALAEPMPIDSSLGVKTRFDVVGTRGVVPRRRRGPGPLRWWRVREWLLPKRRLDQGCGPVTQACGVVPWLPSRARVSGRSGSAGVGDEVPVDDVADPALEGSDGFLGGVTLGELVVIEAAARAVTEPNLGDGGDVEGVVEGPVAAPGQPVGGPPGVSRGPLDGGGAVGGPRTCRRWRTAAGHRCGRSRSRPGRRPPRRCR